MMRFVHTETSVCMSASMYMAMWCSALMHEPECIKWFQRNMQCTPDIYRWMCLYLPLCICMHVRTHTSTGTDIDAEVDAE